MNFCLTPENEKPLDNLISGGGFASIFRNTVCIGDSLSSGEFQLKDGDVYHYYDMFDYSWGQFMARQAGINVLNYSKGGMTAKAYRESFAEQRGFWDESVIPEAYIIALGENDVRKIISGDLSLGQVEDVDFENIDNCKDTFIGNYGYIIARYKKISPDSFFFIVTIPRREEKSERAELGVKMNEKLRQLAEKAGNTFVIDLEKYAPVYGKEFYSNYFLYGHMNPMGYELTARMMISYIDYIVRHNMKTFNRVGFINPENNKFFIQ